MKADPESPGEAETGAGFGRVEPGTIGAEEEYMLLRPGSLDLAPEAEVVLGRVEGDVRFTGELPASQVEARTTPCRTIGELARQLSAARRDLAGAVAGTIKLASAGTHPLAAPEGELSASPRYEAAIRQYGGAVLRRQLVNALQIHVAPGNAATALATYNSLRSYLPQIAAIAANAPFLAGEDTGLASIRPQISLLLPRQGIPPAFESWEEFGRELEWGGASGVMVRPGNWWWELRPRPDLGTLEVRVPDAQTTLAESASVAAFVHCLVMWLARRHGEGAELPTHPGWRIAENRWLAARDGIDAALADLDTGERRPLRESLKPLLQALAPIAAELECSSELAAITHLLRQNGAARQREVAAERGLGEVPGWLSEQFLAGTGETDRP